MSRPFLAHAVPMVNDPNGFQNLAWGATLTTRPDLEVTTAGPHVNEFQSRNGAPSYAGIPVESVRFLSVDNQFARVTIRYQGDDQHKQILAYLEQQFGSLERIPGQMMRGINHNIRGAELIRVNLTYHANTGVVILSTAAPGPRFNDLITDSAGNMPRCRHTNLDLSHFPRLLFFSTFCEHHRRAHAERS
jgi:hypothetical protein